MHFDNVKLLWHIYIKRTTTWPLNVGNDRVAFTCSSHKPLPIDNSQNLQRENVSYLLRSKAIGFPTIYSKILSGPTEQLRGSMQEPIIIVRLATTMLNIRVIKL